jgi:hypothetical protein
MAKWHWLLSAALAAMSSVATVQAQEEGENAQTVDIDKIPAPARRAIREHISDGILEEVWETWRNGEPVYSGRIRRKGGPIVVTVDAAGDVLDLKRQH